MTFIGLGKELYHHIYHIENYFERMLNQNGQCSEVRNQTEEGVKNSFGRHDALSSLSKSAQCIKSNLPEGSLPSLF